MSLSLVSASFQQALLSFPTALDPAFLPDAFPELRPSAALPQTAVAGTTGSGPAPGPSPDHKDRKPVGLFVLTAAAQSLFGDSAVVLRLGTSAARERLAAVISDRLDAFIPGHSKSSPATPGSNGRLPRRPVRAPTRPPPARYLVNPARALDAACAPR